MKNSFALKKFLGLYALLLVLIPAVVFLSGTTNRVGDLRSQAAPPFATVTFWPVQANLKSNQEYDVELRVDPTLRPVSLDTAISYDPQIVQMSIESPIPGDMYEVYQARLVDNDKGLAGISGRGELREGNKFATLKIMTLAPGDPKFSVNYANGNNVEIKVNLPRYLIE
ncbi:hypothetical protein HY345_03520 [Candidatus Microgenomates bacterium]|nr:hypothetical protein [Candidatus Microgenomates bacterium]